MDRDKQIVRASITNIVGNVGLAITKGITGIFTGSIAIKLDAINSLADALSSVIAIIGTKLAGRPADRTHPFGYGRMEYLTSITIAALILATGFSSFIESVKSILHPSDPTYTSISIIIVAIAACVKYGLGFYLLSKAKALESGSLRGSGTDSFMDGTVSVATCVAAIVYVAFGLKVEPWLAAAISILIMKSGIELLLETASKLLGERISPDVAERVEQEARNVDEVQLANGLVLHDFGPSRLNGSIHVTVDGQMTVADFDAVARKVQRRVYQECGVTLSGVTPYPSTTNDKSVEKVRAAVGRIVWRHEHVLELRGLYVDAATATVRLDAIVEFGVESLGELREQIVQKCEQSLPSWNFDIRVLPDVGD